MTVVVIRATSSSPISRTECHAPMTFRCSGNPGLFTRDHRERFPGSSSLSSHDKTGSSRFNCRRVLRLKVDLFERARNHIHNSRNIDEVFVHAVNAFIGICEALDSEGGLGCSDDLLGQIDEFVVELKEEAHFGPWNYRALEGLFAAYSKVFQPNTPRHMYTLGALWGAIDIKLRARLMTGLSKELDRHSQRSNIQGMYRALTDMNMI
ncbi:hypothetical protein DL764_004172 [Monosporascus ibericus]|uniref:Uncharacterized protein n=1 Tax=Monosporascus ibericus TaxID=155417 RepID=A0A4Q4TFL0_9PEZI|nr:hypothetical protein DL764_004172 [Monosporascus ibericus]